VEGRDHLKDLNASGNSNRMDIKEVGGEVVNWGHLVHGRDQWWVIVNKVMNSHLP
jgi:hypothetical protein